MTGLLAYFRGSHMLQYISVLLAFSCPRHTPLDWYTKILLSHLYLLALIKHAAINIFV